MIETYSEYIDKYLRISGLGKRPSPGEHHFVSVYLVPKLFAINNRVPDYINPDGTKQIIGDITYYNDQEHQFGIEVKLGTIRLTKGEFNEWIVNEDRSRWPHTFIGIGTIGIGICSWERFRAVYLNAVKEQNQSWVPEFLESGYGPSKKVNVLLPLLRNDEYFKKGESVSEAAELEQQFLSSLKTEVDC